MSNVASPMKKSQQSIRAPLHVNLRTQQRRLRHVRSLSVRNLMIPSDLAPLSMPLDVELKFSLHQANHSDIAFYTSHSIQETYNPTWGSLLFDYSVLGQSSVLNSFIVKVWQVTGDKDVLCFEKLLSLQNFVFLGLTMIRTDNTNYPSNSVVIGMPEGYFIDSRDGGYPSPRRSSHHKVMEYLPPQSLIEVKRVEVQDSYEMNDLKRLIGQQERLNKLRSMISKDKERLRTVKAESALKAKQKDEAIRLVTRCELLKKQIEEQKQRLVHEREKLAEMKKKQDQRENELQIKKEEYLEGTMKYDKHRQTCSQKRDLLIKTQRKMYLRQRVMIAELAETFCIREMNGAFTICGVILPNGDPSEGGAAQYEQIGVALGFVTHLVYLLAKFLLVPLQYTLQPNGSKSLVVDNVHEEQSTDFKDFPLYVKGVDKSLFQFGLYLLWRDILQLRQHCGYSNSRSSVKKTLPNLKSLLDRLVKDRYSVSPLSEISPPSISITGPTISNPSPRTSSYYFTTPQGSYSVRGSIGTHTFDNSETTAQNTPPRGRKFNNNKNDSSPSSSNVAASNDVITEPVMLRRSPQIRRHQDGFVLKESLSSPHSPSSFDNFDSLSQSPDKSDTSYAVDIPRPLSNTDQTILSLNSDNSRMFSCSQTDDSESLPFSPSPSNVPNIMTNNIINPSSIEMEHITQMSASSTDLNGECPLPEHSDMV